MHDRFRNLIGPRDHAVHGILTLVVFGFFAVILRPFVPFPDEPMHTVAAIYTAGIIAGVFWIASYMFRLVQVDEARRKAARE